MLVFGGHPVVERDALAYHVGLPWPVALPHLRTHHHDELPAFDAAGVVVVTERQYVDRTDRRHARQPDSQAASVEPSAPR